MASFLTLIAGLPRMSPETALGTIYDQLLSVGSTITAGTSVTLPASGSYIGAELEVFFNTAALDVDASDFSYVGSGTKTQITFPFDLLSGDKIRFRIARGP